MEVEIYQMTYNINSQIENKIEQLKEVRILGDYFVENNFNKGSLIINNKKVHLKSIVPINNLKQNKITMIINKNIYNKSCMFKNCELLESLTKVIIDKDEKEEQSEEKIEFNFEIFKIK